MKKYVIILCIFLVYVFFITGCGEQEDKEPVTSIIYTYSGESFDGTVNDDVFTITVNSDGTYIYSESLLASYIGGAGCGPLQTACLNCATVPVGL